MSHESQQGYRTGRWSVMRLEWLAAAVALTAWGSVYGAIKVALTGFAPAELAFIRLVVGALVLSLFAALGRRTGWDRLTRQRSCGDYLHISVIGMIGFVAYWQLLNLGQQTVQSGAASLIINTTPALAAVMAVSFLHERLLWQGWVGIGTSFVGVSLISLHRGDTGRLELSRGTLALVAAAFVHALHFVYQKRVLRRLSPFEVTFGSMLVGAVVMTPFVSSILDSMRNAQPVALAAAAYLGVFPSAIAHFAWAYVLSTVPAARATSLLTLVTPIAVAVGVGYFNEPMTVTMVMGGVLAIVGVVLVQRGYTQKRRA